MSSASSSGSAMMTPYLHFATGDYLLLKTWQPTSGGAIAGACIGLVVLALFERWLAATRGALDLHWRQRAFALTVSKYPPTEDITPHKNNSSDKSLGVRSDVEEPNITTQKPIIARTKHSRTVTPFIAAHDIPRGILYSFQMFIMYLLMLAVMTFQAAYLISIVLGLGIGEMLFGRLLGRFPVYWE